MSQITAKGQVTIPKYVREKLGLRPGDQVEFVETEGEKGVFRVKKKVDPVAIRAAIEKYRGYFKGLYGTDSDALVEEMRGPRLDEQEFAEPGPSGAEKPLIKKSRL
jgi:AbrB family looped-hinge helix DNA binding protein